jgi:probable rRNA maturation factor
MSTSARTRRKKAVPGALMLTLLNRCGERLPSARSFMACLECALWRNPPGAPSRRYALTLTVTDDDEMSRLARRFLGKRAPTDVLAFEDGGPADAGDNIHLGDVVISRDRAVEEARSRGVAVKDELRLYALHGLLHILGYRDDAAAPRRRMFREQRAILGDSAGDLD